MKWSNLFTLVCCHLLDLFLNNLQDNQCLNRVTLADQMTTTIKMKERRRFVSALCIHFICQTGIRGSTPDEVDSDSDNDGNKSQDAINKRYALDGYDDDIDVKEENNSDADDGKH
jgi:hypothetical protein